MTDEFDELSPEEKKQRFQEAKERYDNGFIMQDYAIKSLATFYAEEAMDDAGLDYFDFSKSQREVIYEAASQNLRLDYFMNPKFSAYHMNFILEQLNQNKDVEWLQVGKFHRNIVRKPLTKKEIDHIRRDMAETNRDSVLSDLREKQKEVAKTVSKGEKQKSKGAR